MNWFMTFVFLIFIFGLYQVFGNMVLKFFNYNNSTKSKELIAGFIFTTFVQWIIGFPCQLLAVSWSLYFYLLLFVYFSLIILYIIRYKQMNKRINLKINEHFKSYWFIYALAIAFSLFSMTNQLAYFEMNYDDSYYLAAIVQNINADHIASADYFTGTAKTLDIARLINTFEIGYGFWSSLFHIDAIFFARATMVMHNYFILFMASHALLSCWSKHKYYTQYALAAYAVLLVPSGYLTQRGLIRMYDAWQMNTAIWYGGSLLRVGALPILFTFSFDLLKRIELKKCLFIAMIFCTMISFSSIFTTYASLFLLLMCSFYCLKKIKGSETKKEKIIWGLILLLGWSIVIFSSVIYLNIYGNANGEFSYSKNTYIEQRNYLLGLNPMLIAAILFSLIGLKFIKNKSYYIVLAFSILCLTLFRISMFDNFILLTCMDVSFAALRMMTSIQLVLLLLAGYIVLTATKNIVDFITYSVLVLLFICVIVVYNLEHMNLYEKIDVQGSGLSKQGFSIERLLTNDQMGPTVFKDIGDFFNSLPNKKYRVVAPYLVTYEGESLRFYTGLNYSSHNIEVCTSDRTSCDDIISDDKHKLAAFAMGGFSRGEVEPLLEKYKIDYIIVDKETTKNRLLKENCELVSTSVNNNQDEFYILERK